MTPLIRTAPGAPGAAKFLVNWPTTDVNIAPAAQPLSQDRPLLGSRVITEDERRSRALAGVPFLSQVRMLILCTLEEIACSGNPNQTLSCQLKLRQWRAIEKMLVERDPS
jgi:hypothetical protein